MEGKMLLVDEDISARMMRRARCLHSYRYSTDVFANIKMLEGEKEQLLSQHHMCEHETYNKLAFDQTLSNIDQLTHLWRWVALIEDLCCAEQRDGDDTMNSNTMNVSNSHSEYAFEDPSWTAKSLLDSGILKLLRMSSRDSPEDNTNWMDNKSTSEALYCDEFDSPMRR